MISIATARPAGATGRTTGRTRRFVRALFVCVAIASLALHANRATANAEITADAAGKAADAAGKAADAVPGEAADTAGPPHTAEDRLLVFTQPGASDLARHFTNEILPAITAIAETLGVSVHAIDVRDGAPADVHLTPLLVFQNEHGRSIYQGRYGETKQVRHFLKTTRALAQDDESYERNDLATSTEGRMRVGAPVKVTPLAGALPDGYDSTAFREEATALILDALDRFEHAEEATFGPSDRLFHMDFHPYLSEDGELYVSTAVFSQFNCDFPVHVETEEPVSGDWDDRDDVFRRAVRILERRILAEIEESRIGDGFDPLSKETPVMTFEALGFPLPAVHSHAASAGEPAGGAGFLRDEIPDRWTVTGPAVEDASPLQFRFPAPLERYAGYSDEIAGELVLGDSGRTWEDASGWIEIPAERITMGNAMLDAGLHGTILQVAKYPNARFRMDGIVRREGTIEDDRGVSLTATGLFVMTGIEYPVEVEATLTPRRRDGQPVFDVTATFDIRLADPFDIEGPEGPEPANDTVLFFLNFMLTPAETRS